MAALESIGEPPQENLDIATSTSIRPNRVEDFFHLVLVHNHGENGRSHATRPFWSNLFTNALVSEFCISDTNSTVRYTLLRNAQALLRKIAGDRTHWRYDDSDAPKPGEYVPCVFLGFGIGRYVIQQAMVLASQDYVYRHLPNDTAALFLVLDPMKTNGKLPWIIHVAFNFIPDRKLSLGEMLENLNRDYENVGCSCDIINIPDLALDYDVPPRKKVKEQLYITDRNSAQVANGNPWAVNPGLPGLDSVQQAISRTVQTHWKSSFVAYYGFLRFLTDIEPGHQHQVYLELALESVLRWIQENPFFITWAQSDDCAHLHIEGPMGSGTAVAASHIVAALQGYFAKDIVLSFSANKQYSTSCSSSSILLSLVRQLLLKQGSLFRRVRPLCEWIAREGILTAGILESLFEALLNSTSQTVFCVLHGITDQVSGAQSLVKFLHRMAYSSKRDFKFTTLSTAGSLTRSECVQCSHLHLSDVGWLSTVVKALVQAKTSTLFRTRPGWAGLAEIMTNTLTTTSTDYLDSVLNIGILEKTRVSSSTEALATMVEKLPLKLSEKYHTALNTMCSNIGSHTSVKLMSLMSWITHSIRPLGMSETATILALESGVVSCIEDLDFKLPQDLEEELDEILGTFIKIINGTLYPIHKDASARLLEIAMNSDFVKEFVNPDCSIALKCLELIELFAVVDQLEEAGSHHMALLNYAVLSWPEHARRALQRCQYAETPLESEYGRMSSHLRNRIIEFFDPTPNGSYWYSIYRQFTTSMADQRWDLDTRSKRAARFGFTDLFELFIFDDELNIVCNIAAYYGHITIVRITLERGASCTEALHYAAAGGDIETLQFLCNKPGVTDHLSELGFLALEAATREGHEDVVALLLRYTAKCQAEDLSKLTAMQIAARTGQHGVIQLLLKAGADTRRCDDDGYDALRLASAGGFDDIVHSLLAEGAIVDGTTSRGETALHLSVSNGHLSTCRILLQFNADIALKTNSGLTPIHIAAEEGLSDVLEVLLSHARVEEIGLGHDKVNSSPLHLAATRGHLHIIRQLISAGLYSSDRDRAFAIYLAIDVWSDRDVENLLVENTTAQVDAIEKFSGSQRFRGNAPLVSNDLPFDYVAMSKELRDLNILDGTAKGGHNPLHLACIHDNKRVVKRLLDVGGESLVLARDPEGFTPFGLAATYGHVKPGKAILEYAAGRIDYSVLEGNEPALKLAIQGGRSSFVDFLVEHGWDMNLTNDQGDGPLHLAAHTSNDKTESIIMSLVACGIGIDARNRFGDTALHHAVKEENDVAVRALLLQGADADAEDRDDATPLWLAAYYGCFGIIKQLLNWKANPNCQKSTGQIWTALHAAYDQPEIIKLLLTAGADATIRDGAGQPPIFLTVGNDEPQSLQVYLSSESDYMVTGSNGETVVHEAAGLGRLEMLRYLVDARAAPDFLDEDGTAPIHYAAAGGHAEVIDFLTNICSCIELDCAPYGTPLMAAAMFNQVTAVSMLIYKGAKVGTRSNKHENLNALDIATLYDNVEVLRKLLANVTDAEDPKTIAGNALEITSSMGSLPTLEILLNEGKQYTGHHLGAAIKNAVESNQADVVERLLRHAISGDDKVGYNSQDILVAAVKSCDTHIVDVLLQHGVNPNSGKEGGESALHAAAQLGLPTMVRLLVGKGAKLSRKDHQGRGILSTAILWRSDEIIPDLLGSRDVDINEIDKSGQTPIIHAAIQRSNVADLLLSKECRIDHQDIYGRTALMYGVMNDDTSIISVLLKYRADPHPKDMRDRSALYWAALKGGRDTFDAIVGAISPNQKTEFSRAIFAAIAANRVDFVSKLLEIVQIHPETEDSDGWSLSYTVQRFRNEAIATVVLPHSQQPGKVACQRVFKSPTRWHTMDRAPFLRLSLSGRSINVVESLDSDLGYGLARADYPIHPAGADAMFSFEIRIDAIGAGNEILAVGLCDETERLVYTSDDQESLESLKTSCRLKVYNVGDVITCYTDFGKDAVSFSYNGNISGPTISGIRGKLYPSVWVESGSKIRLSTRFCDGRTGQLPPWEESSDIFAPDSPEYQDEHISVTLAEDDSDTAGAYLLADKIEDSLVKGIEEFGGLEFLPKPAIQDLLRRKWIASAIEEFGVMATDSLINYIVEKAGKVFLTLVLTNNLQYLVDLHDEGLEDCHLPLGKSARPGLQHTIGTLDEEMNSLGTKYWTSFSRWRRSHVNAFLRTQWLFLAATFDGDRFYQQFDASRPLPFISMRGLTAGPFSDVCEVMIHDAHLDSKLFAQLSGGPQRIALKRVRQARGLDDDHFQRELESLRIIKDLNHDYLIRPIGAFQRGQSRCFLFPWADGGNLWDYWSRGRGMGSTREAPSQELILWTIRQMRGLSDALDWLHEANCRHGDLKPENILFFSQLGRQGHLVISDAGLAKVHILSTTERRTSTGTKMGTRRYEPPEVYLGIHGQALSRAYDVWSMGCIFMEFLVWLLYGYDEFRELNRLEKFWEVDVEEPQSYITVGTYQRDQFRVAGRVKEWLDKLSGSSVEGTSLYELVQIIGSRLLVVHVGRENTETQRATAHELSSRMDDIYRRALREAERDVPMVSIPKTRHAQTLSPAHEAPKSSPRPLLPLPPKPLGSDYSLRRKADDVYSHRRTAEDAYSSRGTADNVYSRRK